MKNVFKWYLYINFNKNKAKYKYGSILGFRRVVSAYTYPKRKYSPLKRKYFIKIAIVYST